MQLQLNLLSQFEVFHVDDIWELLPQMQEHFSLQ